MPVGVQVFSACKKYIEEMGAYRSGFWIVFSDVLLVALRTANATCLVSPAGSHRSGSNDDSHEGEPHYHASVILRIASWAVGMVNRLQQHDRVNGMALRLTP